jgi:hypothetical protein
MNGRPSNVDSVSESTFAALAEAALDKRPIDGWTHNFYRYPARFSPRFAAAAIEQLSSRGDLVLDPYMGGGTAVVEAAVAGRRVIGNDLNSLATFITRTKTTPLSRDDVAAIRSWSRDKVPLFNYHNSLGEHAVLVDPAKTKNLSIPRARFIKKVVATALGSIGQLPTAAAQDFARAVVLRAGQWALDGRVRHTRLSEFRNRLVALTDDMVLALDSFARRMKDSGGQITLLNINSTRLKEDSILSDGRRRVSLVVTSPPYPGVHVLYHRWQVDGRRESPAPYWITGCTDGEGASFYNFGDRRRAAADNYFATSFATLESIRSVMRRGGYIVQMLAFNRPEEQLPRYLTNMTRAGFEEARALSSDRIWRVVPRRKWHATLRGNTHSSEEVVLVHRAI